MKNFKAPHIQSQPIHLEFSLKGLSIAFAATS